MERRFDGLQMEHVPRAMNAIADELSKLAARRDPVPPGVFIERLTRPSIAPAKPKVQKPPCPGKETLALSSGARVVSHPGKETSTSSSGARTASHPGKAAASSSAGDPTPGYPGEEPHEKDLLPEKHAVLAVER